MHAARPLPLHLAVSFGWTLLALVGHGCHFSPTYPEGVIACHDDTGCPDGFVCKQEKCYRPGTRVDGRGDADQDMSTPDGARELGADDGSSGDVLADATDDASQDGGIDVAPDALPGDASPDTADAHGVDAADGAVPDAGCTAGGKPCNWLTGVVGGVRHSCAVTAAGNVKCWGSNALGQLGNNGGADSYVAVDVCDSAGASAGTCAGLLSGVRALAAGDSHTCALTTGGVKCWGDGQYGQLGASISGAAVPRVVSSLTGITVTAIAAGMLHNCVLTSQGAVKCWGYNPDGRLGNNTGTSSTTPVDVCGNPGALPGSCSGLLTGISAIAAGGSETCALLPGGGVKCWGSNSAGQIGNNDTANSLAPSDVCAVPGALPGTCDTVLSGAVEISVGRYHACARGKSGLTKCWGADGSGQLGNNTTKTAIRVATEEVCATAGATEGSCSSVLSGVTALGPAGADHTCAIAGGSVLCWGNNSAGQLGDRTLTTRLVPVAALGLTNAIAIAAAYYHTCAVTSVGGVKCWGHNESGQVGNGSVGDVSSPVDVSFP